MIAELLLLQGLLDKTDMVTPSQTTTSTGYGDDFITDGYIERGRKGYGV